MTRTIRIEDDVYDGLKKLASPFEDTPSMVIKRLLEKEGVIQKSIVNPQNVVRTAIAPQVREGKLTPQYVYEAWLLKTLQIEFNGRASKDQATKATIKAMVKNNLLTQADYQIVTTGETKAANTIAWGRNRLKELGFIRTSSQRGVWELSESGMAKAKKLDPSYIKTPL